MAGSFDREKFLGPEQQDKYKDLESRNIWSKRTFNISPQEEFKNCLEIIKAKNWQRLCIPLT